MDNNFPESTSGTGACSSLSTQRRQPAQIAIYDFGDQNFFVFEDANRLRTDFRMICHSIYHVKGAKFDDNHPVLPLVLLPEQVHVLFENAQIRRIKEPAVGRSTNISTLHNRAALLQNQRKRKHCEDNKIEENDESRLHELARKILIGRRLKASKRAALGPDASSCALKIRKLDYRNYKNEAVQIHAQQQQESGADQMEINGGKDTAAELANGIADEEEEEVRDAEMIPDEGDEVEQMVQELRMRNLQKEQESSCTIVSYGFPSVSDYELPTSPPAFPETHDYCIRLVVFRDLWRKGFYLTAGTKFGCDYLAYEKPPGEQHSRFMVVCADVNNPLRPLSLVSVSRASTQVNKHILLAIVSPGALIPYYMEMNWWKGDR